MALPLAKFHLLVVEDEYYIADDIAQALRRLGAEVIGPAADRDEAVSFLEAATRIDGAVLDINLHGQPIYPVADLLRARGVPIVFATGYGAAAIPERFEEVPRWEKPFDTDRLARTLPGLLRRTEGAAA
jgi:CheY-like chemotaxis protein